MHNRTLYELWKERKLNLDNLRVWDFSIRILIPSYLRSKLDNKIIKAIFIGYSENSKDYRFIIHNSDGSKSVT